MHFFKRNRTLYLVTYFVHTFFTTSVILPTQLKASEIHFDEATINFNTKIERLCKKLNISLEINEVDTIINCMFDIKEEVEKYTGQTLDINEYLDRVFAKAKENGIAIEEKYIKEIKQDFINRDLKQKHRISWLNQCNNFGIPYSIEEADLYFDSFCELSKSKRHRIADEQLPVHIVAGVSFSLCGIFLFCIPIPVCTTLGGYFLGTGIGFLASESANYLEKQRLEKLSQQ